MSLNYKVGDHVHYMASGRDAVLEITDIDEFNQIYRIKLITDNLNGEYDKNLMNIKSLKALEMAYLEKNSVLLRKPEPKPEPKSKYTHKFKVGDLVHYYRTTDMKRDVVLKITGFIDADYKVATVTDKLYNWTLKSISSGCLDKFGTRIDEPEPKPKAEYKFKIGDCVHYYRTTNKNRDVVLKIEGFMKADYKVSVVEDKLNNWTMKSILRSCLNKFGTRVNEPKPEPKPKETHHKFKVGDRILFSDSELHGELEVLDICYNNNNSGTKLMYALKLIADYSDHDFSIVDSSTYGGTARFNRYVSYIDRHSSLIANPEPKPKPKPRFKYKAGDRVRFQTADRDAVFAVNGTYGSEGDYNYHLQFIEDFYTGGFKPPPVTDINYLEANYLERNSTLYNEAPMPVPETSFKSIDKSWHLKQVEAVLKKGSNTPRHVQGMLYMGKYGAAYLLHNYGDFVNGFEPIDKDYRAGGWRDKYAGSWHIGSVKEGLDHQYCDSIKLIDNQNTEGEVSSTTTKEGEPNMSKINIKKLDKALAVARDTHKAAIEDSQKAAKVEALALVEKFFEKQGAAVQTEEKVLVSTSSVTCSDFDDLRAQLALLDGDSVDSSELIKNPFTLIKNAGALNSEKRHISISSF